MPGQDEADLFAARLRIAQYLASMSGSEEAAKAILSQAGKMKDPGMLMDMSNSSGHVKKLPSGKWQLDIGDGKYSLVATSDDPGSLYAIIRGLRGTYSEVAPLPVLLAPALPPEPVITHEVKGPPEVHIGDAERDKIIFALQEHFAAGRLTSDELGSRMDNAMQARFQSELDPLLIDLPQLPATQKTQTAQIVIPAPASVPARRRSRIYADAARTGITILLAVYIIWMTLHG